MIVALAVALGLTVPIIVALACALVALYREGQRSRANVGESVKAALAEQAAVHAAQIEALHGFYRGSLTAIGNTLQYGTPTPEPASVQSEPTPEQELGRAIQEDTIARGVEALREEFKAAGIAMSDEELRDQAIAIILGQPIPEPSSVAGLIDRGVPVAAIE